MKFEDKRTRYVLGIDFGTLSGRALMVNADTGEEVAWADHNYKNAVIEEALPGSKKRLKPLTALQDPADYIEVLKKAVPRVLRLAKAKPEQVLGIGIDFTSCTMLPTLTDGTPLCSLRKWRNNPHAWVKLWKHHAAQPEANRINEIGSQRKEDFITAYGGKYSSEWFFAKMLETVREAPRVYAAAERFVEAGDWLVWQLTGEEKRCLSAAGFKAMRVSRAKRGRWAYPDKAFFKSLDARMANVVAEKLDSEIIELGDNAGGLTPKMAKAMGLAAGTPVAAANIDAHAAVPACTVTDAGKLVMIMGTSTCHLLAAKREKPVEGICGVVQDGVIPGYWGYEAGQSGVGDVFAWYVQNGIPA
ncbi:MAG: ribulokinase, partial [Verrucomicrobia bacterium]|nr:ribulokinase [Verrucomicrobiota bacterium]